ncbi:hypothetical protein V502_05160 [Pseudogymnoascus sp. VKM F-4520 (FW-2644)]|nr:hypothetical protein V502_05160 [Pseudogymnoascus sp. VKM F-4520 (FW-2644)]
MASTNVPTASDETSSETEAHLDDNVYLADSLLECDFEIDEDALEELGGEDEDSADPSELCEATGELYSQMIPHARVRAAIAHPVTFARFKGSPACLITLIVEFTNGNATRRPRVARFKNAFVSLEFEGLGVSGGPEIKKFCPENYEGPKTNVTIAKNAAWSVNLSYPGMPISGGSQIGKSESYDESYHETITGYSMQKGGSKHTIMRWEIYENPKLRRGVPRYIKFVMVVANAESKPFLVKLDLSAKMGFGLDKDVNFGLRNKNKSLSVKIDPEALQKGTAGADNRDLGEADLGRYTNLQPCTVGSSFVEY